MRQDTSRDSDAEKNLTTTITLQSLKLAYKAIL